MVVQPNTRIIYFNRFSEKWCYDVVDSKEDMDLFVHLLIDRFDNNCCINGVEHMNMNGNMIDVYTTNEKIVDDHKIWDEFGGPVSTLDESSMYKWVIHPKDVFVNVINLVQMRNGSILIE
jgi:hypothetical protein